MNRNEFFQALPLTRLALRLTNATLEICTDDIEDIHLMISGDTGDVEALRITAAADTLTVEQPVTAMAKSAAVASSWMQLALRIPASWKGRIEARSVTGLMNLRTLQGTDLALDTVSGMVMGTDLSFITVSIRSVIGDVKLSQVRCEKCSAMTTSGDVCLSGASIRTLSSATVTGHALIDLAAPFEELVMNTVTGDMSVDAPISACDAALRSVSGRIRRDGVVQQEGSARIRATSVSGCLDIAHKDV